MWTRANAVREHGAENALLKMAENRRQNGLQKQAASQKFCNIEHLINMGKLYKLR